MARTSQIAWRLKILKTKFYASPLARRYPAADGDPAGAANTFTCMS